MHPVYQLRFKKAQERGSSVRWRMRMWILDCFGWLWGFLKG